MKILDRYILTSFITTFLTVFVILFLIFILQTVWLFIGELTGKDLDLILIIKFLAFKMPSIVPLVLPLSIVLSSIMTFGSFAENYEFAAMKSAGISLQRAMRGLSIFILLLSIASFAFANNVIPYAEYKFINFRRNIAQVKPALAIAEGQFSEVGTYNIKVNKKSGDNGNILHGVTIHKRSETIGGGNNVVIKAKGGELISSEESNILQLVLKDGHYYEDIYTRNPKDREKMPFAKSSFKRYVINIDLSKLNKTNVNDEVITNTNTMLNVSELQYTIDSLNTSHEKEILSFSDNIYQRIAPRDELTGPGITPAPTASVADANADELLSLFPEVDRSEILRAASSNISNTTFSIDTSIIDLENRDKNINNHYIALYDKFVIAFSCFLMFFIGAPLGAIIRKGGLGLPIVFAIAIFIVFHFINTFGKKLAQENGITPFLGTWMSTIVLAPLAVMLTHRATNDKQVTINFDWLLVPIRKMFGKTKSADLDSDRERVVNLAAIKTAEDEDWRQMQGQSDSILINTVYNAKKFGYTEKKRVQALKTLESRGITQEDLLRDGKLYNRNYETLTDLVEGYRLDGNLTFVLYLIATTLVLVVQNNYNLIWLVIPAFVIIVGFYVMLYRTLQRLNEIEKIVSKDIGPNEYIVLILGIPLYFIFYFTNRKALQRALQESNV